MIDPTEKLNSIGNSMKNFGDDLKNLWSGDLDTVKDGISGIIPGIYQNKPRLLQEI
jgi:hypothetical protein